MENSPENHTKKGKLKKGLKKGFFAVGNAFKKVGTKIKTLTSDVKTNLNKNKESQSKGEDGRNPKGFNVVKQGDEDLLNLKQLAKVIDYHFKEGKLVSIHNRRKPELLKTVISKGVPKMLRAHAYHVFFGGFHHLKGQRYQNQINFLEIIEDADSEQDDAIMEENLEIMKQIDKDLERTYFPQMLKIERFAKLWGCDRKDLLFPEKSPNLDPKILNNKEIKKHREELKLMKRNTKKVLFAYAKLDQDVGYVQGMNSIAAAIVYNLHIAKKELEKNKAALAREKIFGSPKEGRKLIDYEEILPFRINYDEEDAFYIFYALMKYTNMRKFFMKGMKFLQSKIDDVEHYFSHVLPDLYHKMCAEMEVSAKP